MKREMWVSWYYGYPRQKKGVTVCNRGYSRAKMLLSARECTKFSVKHYVCKLKNLPLDKR